MLERVRKVPGNVMPKGSAGGCASLRQVIEKGRARDDASHLPGGGTVTIKLQPNASYEAAWWDPANGNTGRFSDPTSLPTGPQSLTAPTSTDWTLRIRKSP